MNGIGVGRKDFDRLGRRSCCIGVPSLVAGEVSSLQITVLSGFGFLSLTLNLAYSYIAFLIDTSSRKE
jgi:hypothetical protein